MEGFIPDVENQMSPSGGADSATNEALQHEKTQSNQVCFLCLEHQIQGRYAIPVTCDRPKNPRPTRRRRFRSQAPEHEEMTPRKIPNESDQDILKKLEDACYHHVGWWKRWLPCYGITDVVEVKFNFHGVVDEKHGRYPIDMKAVDLDEVAKNCETIISKHTGYTPLGDDHPCLGDYHNPQCEFETEFLFKPCIKLQAESAELRLTKINRLQDLRRWAQEPLLARINKGLTELDGIAQDSCIYDIQRMEGPGSEKLIAGIYDTNNQSSGPRSIVLPLPSQRIESTAQIRGIHFVLGCQIKRMGIILPFVFSHVSLFVALIWLCVVIWRGGGGDWGTAFAFAQVVAASITIAIAKLRM
ncbi:hypothetical protein ACLX1H_001207 [Fusarium chlamydosporum]